MLKLKSYNKILINQTAFIGDVVLTLPLVAKIKEINPNTEIHFLSTKVSSQIPVLLKEVNKVIIFDKRGNEKGFKGILRKIDDLKKEQYDLIISPHRSLRTSVINFFARPKLSVTFDKSAFSFLYKKRVKYQYSIHEIDRNTSLLSYFEEFDNNRPLTISLNFDDELQKKIDNFINEKIKNEFIIIAPGSVWATKRWLPEYFGDVAKELIARGYKVVLSGSKDDALICKNIVNLVNNNNLIDTSGLFTINETIYLISKAKTIITNDSAPIHFAGLTNTKTIAIFGPTIPEFGFAPVGNNDITIQNEKLKCRPCAIHGGNKCPLGTHECMKSILPAIFLEKI